MPSSTVDKREFYRVVHASLLEDNKRMRSQFNKAVACVNDLFTTMSNYDIRFHFDPISIDDCRCEIMTHNEVNLLCTLKEVPIDSCVLQGDVTSGAVMIELADSYTTRPEMASWEDVITTSSSGRRCLNATKLLQALLGVIQRSIIEISQQHDHPDLVCRFSGDQMSIMVGLGLHGGFRINLLPAIQMRRSVGPLQKFERKFNSLFKSLHLVDTTVDWICLVAKPYCADQKLFWRITFNDVENRIFNKSRFICAPHCLHVLDRLCAKLSPFWGTAGHLLRYHLQTVLLGEFKTHPCSKDWLPEKFHCRLEGAITSFCTNLRDKKCLNVFTDVNVFSHFDAGTLKTLAEKLSKWKLDTKHFLSLL